MGCGASSASTAKVADAAAPLSITATIKGEAAGIQQEDIRDKYDLGAILGSGSFGQVREATLKNTGSNEIRAVKMIERDNEDGEWSNQAIFVREVILLQQIDHKNVIRYFDFYEDQHFLYVVMELCKGGEVFAKIVELKRFCEKNAALIGQQMLRAMEYIHQLNIAHRDIKAENFMLAEPSITGVVKMIDFGMAIKYTDGQVLTELCGSPHYLAPELIGQKYGHRADIWAFGVLLYLLMYGHYPYDAKHPRDIMVKILTEPIRWQTKVKLSKNGLDFLKRTLEHDPKKRMSATEALQHPWMEICNSFAETETISTEVIRSAHKKITSTRKMIDPKIDEGRNQKLMKIEEDFSAGIRHGKRLGETPKEEFMQKPEFFRRENKITTAPSAALNTRRLSFMKMLDNIGGKKEGEKKAGDLAPLSLAPLSEDSEQKLGGVVPDGSANEANEPKTQTLGMAPMPEARSKGRSNSVQVPRRLSYIGHISGQEENNLAKLFEEKARLAPQKPAAPAVKEEDEDEDED